MQGVYSLDSTIQVKIKRKQHLVKKELEPIISDDDMKNAAQTEGTHLFIIALYIFFSVLSFFFFFFFSINLYVMDLGNRFNHIDEALIDIYNCTSVFILYYMVMVSQISVQLFTSNKCKLQRILATIWKQVDKWNPND